MFLWLIIIALGIFADQITKYLAVLFLRPVDTVPLLEDVLHLTYVENPGAAFGMLKDSRWVFMIVSTVAIIALLAYMLVRRPKDKLECLAISLIVSGGIGNMIDRVLLGYVVDFVDFRLINFAVFNVADIFVCVGAGLLFLWIILSTVKEARAEKDAALAAQNADESEDMSDSDADRMTDADDLDTKEESDTENGAEEVEDGQA